jgi:PAS domain S-box-containing protein
MRLKPKLRHKLLVLVAIPLMVQLGFLFSLLSNLQQAEMSGAREHRAREALASLNSIYERVSECSRTVGAAVLSKAGGPSAMDFHKMMATIPDDLSNLKAQLSEDPEAIAGADRLEQTLNASLRILDDVFGQLDHGNRIFALQHLRDLRGAIPDLVTQLNELRQRCITVADLNFDDDRRSRSRLNLLMKWAVGVNILMAVALVYFISRNITSRLSVVMENTHRLVKEQELLPAVGGDDEIAHLDTIFKDMATALERAHKKERAIIDTMPAGLAIADDAGNIQMVNPTLSQLLGIDANTISGKPLASLFYCEKPINSDDQFRELISNASDRIVETSALRADGSMFPVEVSMTSLAVFADNHHLLVMLDITERKEIERLKQEFVSMISHDLRTPLTSIQVFVNMLARGMFGEVSENVQRKATMADRNATRLIGLINDLLDIDKMESGQLNLECSPITLQSTIERALESVRGFSDQQGVELICSETISSELVDADSDRLVQVMVNLLGNAIKFSPKYSPVHVSVEESGDWLTVKVTDLGRGVPANLQSSIFERFKQVEAKDSTEKKGTGLGLAICKAIIEQHGGSIGVESEQGKGSTFWFKLPIVKVAVAASQRQQQTIDS